MFDRVTVRTQRDQPDDALTRGSACFVVLVALVDLDRVSLSSAAADFAAVTGGGTDELALSLPHGPAHDGARVLAVQAGRDDLDGQPWRVAHPLI